MDSNSKRIAKNTLFLYLRMGLLMFISLFTSRVLLDKLGVEDFGVYNVIGGMAAMFTFFSSSLANATQRFLNIELGQNNIAKAKQIFQQHFTLYLAIIIAVIIIAEPIGIWLIYNKLVIPADRLIAAVLVFQFTLLSLAATFVGIVFNSEIVSHEDMKIYSYIGIIEGVAKLLICYIISVSDHNRLIFYGLLLLLVNLGIQGSYIRYCIKKYEECKIRLIWNVKLLKETTGIVGWNFIGTLVWMINDNCINLLLNMFFGPVVNAARAISYQINGALLNFTNNFFLSVRPQLMKSYAKGDLSYMNMLLFNSSRYSLYLLYVLAVPIIFCIDQILALWLKTVPEYTNIFSVLIICYSFICVVHAPLWDVALASGQIKRYQIVGSCIFLLVFPISYVFLKLGYPPTTVMYVMIGVRICFYIASVIIVQAIANYSLWNYFSKIFTPVVLAVVPSLVLHFIIKYYIPVSLVWMFIYIFFSILLNIVIIYIIGLNKSERAYILNIVRKKISRQK